MKGLFGPLRPVAHRIWETMGFQAGMRGPPPIPQRPPPISPQLPRLGAGVLLFWLKFSAQKTKGTNHKTGYESDTTTKTPSGYNGTHIEIQNWADFGNGIRELRRPRFSRGVLFFCQNFSAKWVANFRRTETPARQGGLSVTFSRFPHGWRINPV